MSAFLAVPGRGGLARDVCRSAAHIPPKDWVDAIAAAREGWTLVSGFISPGERAVLKTIRQERLGPYVRLLPYGIPAKFDPSVELSREIAEDGAVLLSSFPESVPWGKTTRPNCVEMNRLGAMIGGSPA